MRLEDRRHLDHSVIRPGRRKRVNLAYPTAEKCPGALKLGSSSLGDEAQFAETQVVP
jgi:hypothetical protein